MPFKSKAQRRFMYAKHPKIAKRWSKHTPKGKELPEHVKESTETAASSNLEFKNIRFPSRSSAIATYHYPSEKDNINVSIYYTLGKTFEDVDYCHTVIKDNNDIHSKGISFEDPQSTELQEFVHSKNINITPDDIEMAGQDGYSRIESHFAEPQEAEKSFEESFKFQALFHSLMNEEKL